MALDARLEWSQMTNPFGKGKTQSNKPKPSPSAVADKLRQALTGRRAN